MLAEGISLFWHGATLHDMFVALDVPIFEKMLRPIVIYFFLVIALRIFGKRELTNINPFDFVVLLMLSNTVQNAIIGNDNSVTGGLIGAVTLLATNYVVVRFILLNSYHQKTLHPLRQIHQSCYRDQGYSHPY